MAARKKPIVVEVPIRTVSETNSERRGHWRQRHGRSVQARSMVQMYLRQHLPPKWDAYVVTLTRIAPRQLDREDNLPSALKACRDGVADYLFPATRGNKTTRWADDGGDQVTWLYRQEKGPPRTHAVRIEIHRRERDICPACGRPLEEA